jgi:hypothetical protein
MSSDHERLAALRRITVKRGATKAEAATAKRLADKLAAKIGKKPRARRRKGQAAALPEPPAARWRRLWLVWLEAALHKIAVAGHWVHGIWIVSIIGMLLIFVFGSDTLRREASDIYIVRTLGLLGAGLALMTIAGLLAFAIWWLRTWRSERLRSAVIFLSEHVPEFAMVAACIGLSIYLENHWKCPWLLAYATTLAVMAAFGIPWWRWGYPAIERALQQASNGALRAGVAVLAIAVTLLLAGGVWAHARTFSEMPRAVPPAPSPAPVTKLV